MHGDRTLLALTRIETASRRIREAARAGKSPASDPALGARYETLRRQATETLAELDDLIADLQQ